MDFQNLNSPSLSSRRNFVGKLMATTGAAGLAVPALAGIGASSEASFRPSAKTVGEAEAWFKNVKGEHRVVYDATEPHDGLGIIWPWAFMMTNNQTGTQDEDMTAMVVLRHNAIPFAMKDELWKKYNFGEMFKVTDNSTQAASKRNLYYEPKEGDFPLPGIDGIKAQQKRGAMYCVCDLALSVYSGFAAQAMGLDAEEVKKEWVAGVLPGIQIVPSGVWALGRAQERDCAYIYAGG
jgi:hypothetical protein